MSWAVCLLSGAGRSTVSCWPGRLRELKLLVDHRDDLVAERRRCQQRLRWHLHELDPTLQVPLGALDRDSLARPRRSRKLSRNLRVTAIAPQLLQLPGCGPLSAAKLLSEIGPISRFLIHAQLARHAGVAPLEASSGKHQRHRLDRGGNRQLNCALHRIAITQGRVHPPARAYLERKQNEDKSRREAIRCLKRQLARTIYDTLRNEPALTQEQHWRMRWRRAAARFGRPATRPSPD